LKEILIVDCLDSDGYGRYSYEILRLSQPHIKTDGLYRVNSRNYIVCPDLLENTLALDGTRIVDWFNNNKILGCPIELVKICPTDGERSEERNIDEIIIGKGDPRTHRDVLTYLALTLPRTFPKLNLSEVDDSTITVTLERELTTEECILLKDALLALEIPVKYKIIVDDTFKENDKPYRYNLGQGDMDIIPTKFLPFKPSASLRYVLENDEDFWQTHKMHVFSGIMNDQNQIIPDNWDKYESRCLINASVFPQNNIRNYLSIFQNIIIALPLVGKDQQVLESLGITVEELAELSNLGRVRFILPQSIDRYSLKTIETLVEIAPENFILSRRLAAASIIDTRRRFPFLYPPLGSRERTELLHQLVSLCNDMNPDSRRILEPVVLELGRIWSSAECMINQKGAMATSALGLGALVSTLLKSNLGLDRFIEFYSASTTVEWAAPFSAYVSPIQYGSYSEENLTQILANSYSGFHSGDFPLFIRQTSIILKNILSIDSEVPIIDFASSFGSSDIERLRKALFDLKREGTTSEDIEDLIRKFNNDVRNYEQNERKHASWDISGLIGAISAIGGVAIGQLHPEAVLPLESIPLALWLCNRLDTFRGHNELVGTVLDKISALATKTSPEAVLVARLKRNIKGL